MDHNKRREELLELFFVCRFEYVYNKEFTTQKTSNEQQTVQKSTKKYLYIYIYLLTGNNRVILTKN